MEDEDSVSVELNSYSITLIFRILKDFELLEREADFLIFGSRLCVNLVPS